MMIREYKMNTMTKNSDEERSTFYIPMNVTNGKVNRKVSEIVAEQIKSTDNVLECVVAQVC